MKIYRKIKRCLIPVAILCIVLLGGVVSVKAETGTGSVKGNNVNVRSDAGTTASKVTVLGNGEALVVTGSKKDMAGNTWYAVTFTKNGKEYKGYIIKDYVNYKANETSSAAEVGTSESASSESSADSWRASVTATNVNVRNRSVSGSVIATVSKGVDVTVSRSEKGTDGKMWYYVSFKTAGGTQKGWIRSDFVKAKEVQTGGTTASGTENSTSAADTKEQMAEIDVSGILAQESADTKETDDEKTDSREEEDKETGKPSGSKENVDKQKKTGILIGDYVRVRKKAVSGNVICQLNKGAKLTVVGEEKGSDGYVWYKVSFQYNGTEKSGYIRSDFVKVEESSKEMDETEEKEQDGQEENAERKGILKGDYVRIRKSPVSGAVVCKLMAGTEFMILGEESGTDQMIWYKVSFVYGQQSKEGYVRSDFVEVQETEEQEESEEEDEVDIAQSEEFEAYLTQQGFPESYKDALRSLHNSYPEWEFRAVSTGLNWEDVIAAESRVGTNLVAKNAITSWKSTEKAAYNLKTDTWYTFDGGAWVAASKEIISYYMDPRNFLTEKAIFQFESLEYEEYQNKTGVKRLLEGSFMSGKYMEPDGKARSYASTFVKVGKKVGVSPYHLAARCYQEQGKGTSGSISGKVEGYENIFNYYNIGAYASGGNSPIVQGLKYASSQTAGVTNYGRPWDTHYKSLLGGAEYVAQKYVKVGQNTLYFQKFNVVNKKNGIYRHQYMTNIQAAESEAVKMSKAYTEEDTKLVFYIPVYNNMPEIAVAKPISNTSANNYLASIEIKDQQLTPVFTPETETYDLMVPKSVKKVNINASAVSEKAAVEGTGKVKLKRGENIVEITCTAENGTCRTYTIHIVRE